MKKNIPQIITIIIVIGCIFLLYIYFDGGELRNALTALSIIQAFLLPYLFKTNSNPLPILKIRTINEGNKLEVKNIGTTASNVDIREKKRKNNEFICIQGGNFDVRENETVTVTPITKKKKKLKYNKNPFTGKKYTYDISTGTNLNIDEKGIKSGFNKISFKVTYKDIYGKSHKKNFETKANEKWWEWF